LEKWNRENRLFPKNKEKTTDKYTSAFDNARIVT